MPTLALSFDGAGTTTTVLSNDFQDVAIDVPARPDRAGLTLTLDVAPTFRPGGNDPRELGAQVDLIRCTSAGWAWPPAAAVQAAMTGGALLSAAVALTMAPAAVTAATGLVAGTALATLLVSGAGAFGTYPDLLVAITAWGAALLFVGAWLPVLAGRARLSGWTVAALALAVLAASIKLAALEHPSKPLIDALFQAHRLEWVMSGRYFFTQPMPSGVQFPYAIGLYVTAAPLAAFITDHVLLVRLVALGAEAVGGLCLYAVLVHAGRERAAALVALLLFHLVPGPHVVIGNGNLTNAFAQAIGLAAVCGLALMPVPIQGGRRLAAAAVVTAAIMLAFLSHVGTIVIVATVLAAVTAGFLLARRPDLRTLALAAIVMTAIAGLLAMAVYYRHFMDVYRDAFERVRAPAVAAAPPPVDRPDAPAILVRPLAWHERVSNSAAQTVADLGWPVLGLAAIGFAGRIRDPRDRTTILLLSWGGAWLLLLVTSSLTRVDVQFQRYTLEFVSRVNLAGYPMLVAFAGLGAAWCWRRGRAGQVAATVLAGAAVLGGLASLARWIS